MTEQIEGSNVLDIDVDMRFWSRIEPSQIDALFTSIEDYCSRCREDTRNAAIVTALVGKIQHQEKLLQLSKTHL